MNRKYKILFVDTMELLKFPSVKNPANIQELSKYHNEVSILLPKIQSLIYDIIGSSEKMIDINYNEINNKYLELKKEYDTYKRYWLS